MGQLKKFISVVFVAVLYIGIVKGSSTVIDVGELREDDGDSMNIMTGSSTSLPAHLNDDDTDSIVDSADSPEAFLHESSIDCDDPVKLDEDVKANKSKRQKSVFDGEELREKRPLCKIEKTGSRDTMKGSERTRNNSSKPSNRVALGHQDHTSSVGVESSTMTDSDHSMVDIDEETDSDDSDDIVSPPIDLNADIFLVVLSCMSVPARAVSMIAQLRSVNRNLNLIMEDVIARLDDSIVGDFRAKLELRRLLVTSRFFSRSWTPQDMAWYKQLCTFEARRKWLPNIVATAKRPLFYTSSIPLGDLWWYDIQYRVGIGAIVFSMFWGFFHYIWISMVMAYPDSPVGYVFMALICIPHLVMLDFMLFGFTLRGLIKCGVVKGDPNKTYESLADLYESDIDF